MGTCRRPALQTSATDHREGTARRWCRREALLALGPARNDGPSLPGGTSRGATVWGGCCQSAFVLCSLEATVAEGGSGPGGGASGWAGHRRAITAATAAATADNDNAAPAAVAPMAPVQTTLGGGKVPAGAYVPLVRVAGAGPQGWRGEVTIMMDCNRAGRCAIEYTPSLPPPQLRQWRQRSVPPPPLPAIKGKWPSGHLAQ